MGGRTTDTVLLLHAGIADSRMWRPQADVLQAAGYRVLAPDLRGYGERPLAPETFSHVRDVEQLLDQPAAVVGNSLGGRIALELALHRPDLVERLVLIAPGLPGWEWSDATRAGWAEEEEAFDRGDFESAAEASVRMWVDGPHRSPREVDAGIRADVTAMVLRSYELQRGAWEAGAREEELLDARVMSLLSEIRRPTLVLVGDNDVGDMHAIAAHVAGSIRDARLVTIRNAAHLPSLERPDEINALLIEFLSDS
jgi:pimeloyl-ACP methyl ester carboxylesterase